MALREETIVYPAIVELSACLCTEIQNSELPVPCYCGPIVGDLVLDYCSSCAEGSCGGQAWVRFVEAFPSIEFPSPLLTPQNCNAPLAYQLEIGIMRCKPMGTNSTVRGFSPPTMEAQVDALRLQLADMAAMRRAIQCCFGDDDSTYIMGTYTQSPPDGDCLGGFFTVLIWDA